MRHVVLSVPAVDADLAADRLWAAGAHAVEEVDEVGGATGHVELRTVLAADDAMSLRRLGPVPTGWQVRFEDVDEPASEAWRDHARPIAVADDLVLVPAWLDDRQRGEWCGRSVIEIEPGGSFGLGDHPTTRLSAAAVWERTVPGARVIDVGCGSGVLSVVAARRGAATIVAIDIAEAAREATLANARRNSVAELVDVRTTPLADLDGPFDLVVANILAPTLVALADDLRRVASPAGRIIVSGVLAGRHDHVVTAFEPWRVDRTRVLDAWACVELVGP